VAETSDRSWLTPGGRLASAAKYIAKSLGILAVISACKWLALLG
jgi:hypothetical protein